MFPNQPFDARRALLLDLPVPRDSWRVVSLVTALRECVTRDPEGIWQHRGEDHVVEVMEEITKELTVRGLDGSSLVRYGMFPELVGGVLSLLVPRWIHPDDGPDPPVAETWMRVLGDRVPERLPKPDSSNVAESQAAIVTVIRAAILPVGSWILTAPLADLLRLTPNLAAEEPGRALVRVDEELIVQYRWAVERFSVTRLADWRTPSLHAEYRWKRGGAPAPCREELMNDREVEMAGLETEIAARAVNPPRRDVPTQLAEVQLNLATRMVWHAVALLRNRRYREAAALFEFALSQNPDDAEAANNLGFCLMPYDAAAALRHLDHAASHGYEPQAVNAHNRAVCALLLGNPKACIAVAAEAWENPDESPSATLWRISGSELSLTERADVLRELASVAAQAAALIGDAGIELHWRERAEP